MTLTHSLFCLLFVPSLLWSEASGFTSLYAEFKKGNYSLVSKQSLQYLNGAEPEKDPRIFFLYVSTEENWSNLKSKVGKEKSPNFRLSPHYWNGIYLFMERALVFGESDLLVEWGKDFQKNGKQSPKYNDALLLYGLGLLDLKNESEAKKIFSEIESNSPSKHILSQLEEIKSVGK
ncbi:hypothetical protein EHQ92_06155 [Leptospira biflexa]|uniref:Tetratricopeptide repeat protein n=1 Tax=Leptospira biflexa serovar Patoc (strain Patoc 1 / ATCC 23582 / Paris) TaxID=456481 RepID=B0SJH0_LEPBP|nr:hypothetical protein [Leptospira biflexa]ABZ93051.1 Hypothetical protein LBF_0513 [Leptospira biflexa serovar Patoc strain 'Patoc 1 (Ames)']ABZ96670.1 Conserved hypothetical protein; putative signal peptide [Leptospira biflexa serovar Patoc strain 'Patoc 1 (Paris)']TGM37958.1 hypothetical protein EHQ80_10340 [Leptospira biflexa]TGM41289.1 hypothetical protein EHQ89_04905 [Leptospira biflexa]TGM47491.1 hypothetical protein EHQ92_06155 [Leptospira biflexa]